MPTHTLWVFLVEAEREGVRSSAEASTAERAGVSDHEVDS